MSQISNINTNITAFTNERISMIENDTIRIAELQQTLVNETKIIESRLSKLGELYDFQIDFIANTSCNTTMNIPDIDFYEMGKNVSKLIEKLSNTDQILQAMTGELNDLFQRLDHDDEVLKNILAEYATEIGVNSFDNLVDYQTVGIGS